MGYNATFTNDRKEELILSGNVLHIELSGGEKELQNLILLKQKRKKAQVKKRDWKDMQQNVNLNVSNDEVTVNFFFMLFCIIANNSIVQHLPKHFMYVNLFNPHNDPMKQSLPISLSR